MVTWKDLPAAALISSISSGVGSLTTGTSFAAARGTQDSAEIILCSDHLLLENSLIGRQTLQLKLLGI